MNRLEELAEMITKKQEENKKKKVCGRKRINKWI